MAAPLTRFIPPFVTRNLFGSLCVVVSLAAALTCVAQWRRARQLEDRSGQVRYETEAMFELLASGPLLRRQNAEAAAAVKRIEDHLVVEDNLAENLWHFYKFEEETKIRIVELRQLNAAPLQEGQVYRVIPYAVTLSGTFDQVANYVYRLETEPRVARINKYSLQNRGEDGNISLDLNIELLAQP